MTSRLGRILAPALAAALLGGCATAGVPKGGDARLAAPGGQPPRAGDIVHVPTGLTLDFERAMEMIAAAKVVYVGEMHTNLQAHEAQRRVIAELERRFPGKVAIGMEMFREPQQPALDRWTRGELTELEFLKESKWYENWGSDFGHYRGILELARDRRLDVVALNPPRELQRQFAMAGAGPLPPELAGKIPDTDFADPLQRTLMQAIFKGHDAGPKVFEGFYRTQILWEETMASRIVDYLRSPAGEGKKMVVIAGGFHVRYGLGVPRKALRRAAWPYAIVLPTEISIPEELKDELLMDVEEPEIPLLPADFAWMVEYEGLKSERVRMGVMMRTEGSRVAVDKVVPGSPADQVGIRAGDVFVSVDGHPVQDQGDVIVVVSGKKPGESAKVVIERDGRRAIFAPVLAVPPEPGGHAKP